MKKLLGLGCLVVWLTACVIAPRPTPTPSPQPTWTLQAAASPTRLVTATAQATPTGPVVADVWADLSPFRRAMRPAFAADIDRFADATRYLIDLNVDLDALTVRGQARVRYTNRESVPLSEIVFRLLPQTPGYGGQMRVSAVQANGWAIKTTLRFNESALYVPLPADLLPGQSVELLLDFECALPSDTSAGYAQYGYIEEVLSLPNTYPLIPVYDDEGWNVELGPAYGDATFSDTSLYLVRVTLPSDFKVAASGVLVQQQHNADNTITYTFASGPMRDWNLVGSRSYVAISQQVDDVLVTVYYLEGDERGGNLVLDYATQAMRIYTDLLGAYPFNELDVVATPTTAGGIEYPGLIVVAQSLYDREGGFFEMATIHETAHQWIYSLVGNDQLDEPWLDESLTQYLSLLYFERRYGKQEAEMIRRDSFEGWYKSLGRADQKILIGLPVAAYSEHQYGAIVYGKGPLFFYEVRKQIGDKAFFDALRAYADDFRYEVAYPADLMGVLERVSGQDLDALYQTWVVGP